MPRVAAPTLILTAERDEVIPAASTRQLRDRFPPGRVRHVVIPLASHNTISDDPAYVADLAAVDRAAARD